MPAARDSWCQARFRSRQVQSAAGWAASRNPRGSVPPRSEIWNTASSALSGLEGLVQGLNSGGPRLHFAGWVVIGIFTLRFDGSLLVVELRLGQSSAGLIHSAKMRVIN